MSGVVLPLRTGTRALTREERALVKSVPGVAERAVRDVCKHHGGDARDPDLLQMAHLGIYQAAMGHDAALSSFAHWAYYKAVRAILEGRRVDRRQRKMLHAAELSGCLYLATRPHRVESLSPSATDEELFQRLVELGEEQVVASLVGGVVAAEEPEGEEDVLEREEWSGAVQGLGEVLAELREDQRALLTAFAHDAELKSLAKDRGVNYWTLLDEFHALLKLVRARLAWRGIKRLPTPMVDGWKRVFEGGGSGRSSNDEEPATPR